jgi:hypothetical protein
VAARLAAHPTRNMPLRKGAAVGRHGAPHASARTSVPTALARVLIAAFVLTAPLAVAPAPASAGRTAVRVSRARASAATTARRTGSTAKALARGTLIDGPRHTARAIRRSPRIFATGTVLIGAMGALAHRFGFDPEHVGLALSGAAVAAQTRAAWPTLKLARGRELSRRIGADILWPAALFGLSWGAGHAIASYTPALEAEGAGGLATAFAASAVIGGDAPAVGVTALDTMRGDRARTRATRRGSGRRAPGRR